MGIDLIFLVVFLLFLLWAGSLMSHLRFMHRLPSLCDWSEEGKLSVRGSEFEAVACSIVIAARDEGARLEDTLLRLLGQKGVRLEVIVVDDRSRDSTAAILSRYSSMDSRIRFVSVSHLESGWLGKSHACHLGAGMARGDWILFTDADCWLREDVICRAVRIAEREEVDHVTLSSGVHLERPSAQAMHLFFLMSLANWFSGVNRNRPNAYIGFGAFNLVRSSAYQDCEGYEALRMTVLDDMKLGMLLCRCGKRTRAFLGSEDVICHWGETVGGMIKIFEKNYFAALDYRFAPVWGGGVVCLGGLSLVIIALINKSVLSILAMASPLLLCVPAGVLAKRLKWSWPCVLWIPLMIPAFFYAIFNSAWKTWKQGGIQWRDTFYSLEDLRKGNLK